MKQNLSNSERIIVEHINKHFQHQLTKIAESDVKSPDFELVESGGRAFVLELKDINHVPASKETGWTVQDEPGGIQTAERNSNSTGRVGKKICEAAKQLGKFSEPKGVAFLNSDSRTGVKHLHEAYLGYAVYSDGNVAYRNTVARRISEGKLRDIKDKIDFYIWIEKESGRHFFRHVTKMGQAVLERYFKMGMTNDIAP